MAKASSKKSRVLDSYFPFLEGLNKSAAHLLKEVTSGAFPDLDSEPKDDEEVIDLLEQAKAWAWRVLTAHGQLASAEVGYEHPEPVPILVWFRGSAKQQGRGTTPRLDRAADVLGELPEEFLWCHATDVCQMCNRFQGKVQRPSAGRAWVQATTENWPTLRGDLEGTRILTIVQAKHLVAWVQERIESLKSALIPVFRRTKDLPRNRVMFDIESAGTRREVELVSAEADFLDTLAAENEAKALRRTRSGLVKKIPELDMWIATQRPQGRALTANEGFYSLDEEVRDAVQRSLASKM